jgi:hypothetical protein
MKMRMACFEIFSRKAPISLKLIIDHENVWAGEPLRGTVALGLTICPIKKPPVSQRLIEY